MKIVIIGGGVVGTTIAAQLTNEGHDITVIDRTAAVADQISDSLDCMALAGNGASVELMRSADVPNSDLLIACTAQDELNMLCCVFAKKLGCRSAIARVRTPEYADQMYYFKEELGITISEFILRERMLEAKRLLRETDLTAAPTEVPEMFFASGGHPECYQSLRSIKR